MSYAPKLNVTCPPDDVLFRTFSAKHTTLNPGEEKFIKLRSEKVVESWLEWIKDSDVDYNMRTFKSKLPKVGFSSSGGAGRATLMAASVSNAYDARNETAKRYGTGGLYNVASYVVGLSGGGWATGGLSFANDSVTFPELAHNWILDVDAIPPVNGKTAGLFESIARNVAEKNATGVPVSLGDLWAGLLSPHFLPGTNRDNIFDNSSHGAGVLWSDITSQEAFKKATNPFPIVISCSRSGNETSVSMSDIVYEMTPFEFGSFDPNLTSMINMKFAGTPLDKGKPATSSSCVTNFDQASFMLSSTSDIFDDSKDVDTATVIATVNVLEPGLDKLDEEGILQTLWPNPFKGIKPDTYADTNSSILRLDDGSENHDNVPLEQLLVKARDMDVLVVIDATSETTLGVKNNFPNGTSLNFAEQRLSTLLAANHQQLPPIPDDFAKTGVNLHVTFFGCDPNEKSPEFPLMIYVPNSPPCTGEDPVTNAPSTQSNFSLLHQDRFFDQGFLAATCGFVENSLGIDENFPTCLKCAAIDRARLSTYPVTPRSHKCQKCFDKYCFDPKHPDSLSEFPGRKFQFVSPDGSNSSSTLIDDGSAQISSLHARAVRPVLTSSNSVPSHVLGAFSILAVLLCFSFLINRRR